MKTSQMFVSEWLKPEDLGNEDHHVTIEAVEYDMGKRRGSSEASLEYYLRLREYPKKKMGLNRTNTKVIEGILGDETDNWSGKRITIYATEDQVFDEIKLVLRVRLRPPPAKPGDKSTVPVLGAKGEERLTEALAKIGYTVDELRAWLEMRAGKEGADVMAKPAQWPSEWAADIAKWIKAPERVQIPKHGEMSEDDIPF